MAGGDRPPGRLTTSGSSDGSGAFALREAVEDDLDACTGLALVRGSQREAADWRVVLQSDIDSSECHLVVAETRNAIFGYGRAALLSPASDAPSDAAPRGYYLTGLFVRPDHRRAGIGAALTVARLVWISERANEAWYFANARNCSSIELHRQLGFREVTRRFSVPEVTFEGGEGILFHTALGLWPGRV